MIYYEQLFKEYAKKWGIDYGAVNYIFLMIEISNSYSRTATALNQFGFKISSRRLRYFYKKVILIQRYGNKNKIGKYNYNHLIGKKL